VNRNNTGDNQLNQKSVLKCRVLSQGKTIYKLEHEGEILFGKLSGRALFDIATKEDYPVVGDYVLVDGNSFNSDYVVITEVLARKSLFKRRSSGATEEVQYCASNIDNVLICVDTSMKLNLRKIERFVSLTWESGAQPVIVLTKTDLLEDIDPLFRAIDSVAFGIEMFGVTVNDSNEWMDLFEILKPGTTSMLVGDSGVGKSSLINVLKNEAIMETNVLNKHMKGQHTTTLRELVHLKNGSMIIDTPGLRELGMIQSGKGIEETFADIEELISKCKYRNCSHSNEKGCAVYLAIREGSLSNKRWLSYQKLKKENDYYLDKDDYKVSKEVKFKEISKKQKKFYKMNMKQRN
jgi:ribosome biogenesis GTPase